MRLLVRVNALEKLNIWVDEFSSALLEGPLLYGNELGATQNLATRSITIEWYIPRGAHIIYGLLGSVFTPKTSGVLSTIFVTPETVKSYDSTIAPKGITTPETTLPSDIIDGISKEVSVFFSDGANNTPQGEIVFKSGAYCPVCSNAWIFRRITKLMLLVLSDSYNLSEVRVKKLISLL